MLPAMASSSAAIREPVDGAMTFAVKSAQVRPSSALQGEEKLDEAGHRPRLS
jgi:hypothetical protein